MKTLTFLLLSLCAAPTLSAAPVFIFGLPGTQTVTVGQSFEFSLLIDSPVDLAAWQVDLNYDPSLVSVTAIIYDEFLAQVGPDDKLIPNIDNTLGQVTSMGALLLDTSLGGVTGTGGQLVSIQFTALAPGNSLLTPFNILLLDSTFADIPFETGPEFVFPTNVTIVAAGTSEVPEPATWMLSGAALLLLAKRARRSGPSRIC
jgi:hypothetical protein